MEKIFIKDTFVCYKNNIDLNSQMVFNGKIVNDIITLDYINEEEVAKIKKFGILDWNF